MRGGVGMVTCSPLVLRRRSREFFSPFLCYCIVIVGAFHLWMFSVVVSFWMVVLLLHYFCLFLLGFALKDPPRQCFPACFHLILQTILISREAPQNQTA